ncbi:MAG: hypothetical protein JNL02_11785 [Saprospiraceae bacterium]|nr:hypothetical protein [Saprospiraceae bacterium]
MKKVLFLLPFLLILGITAASAQCNKSASATTGASCCSSKAAKAAAADTNIEKRMAEDGTVSYVRKEADAQGNVRFVSVQYDEASNTFVNVAPKTMTADAKAGMAKKACAGEGAGAGKACCSSGSAQSKSCCSSKAADKKEQ